MATNPRPILTIQTASLFASGDSSTWTGTGGPAAYDPWLGSFSEVVSSRGIGLEPFQDQLYAVDAGDQVTFVIAVQNWATTSAYSLKLRDAMPAGFSLPTGRLDIAVSDGAGNPLNFSGDLFDPSGGLTILDPVGNFDMDSGANVALVTFTLQATASIAVPLANITNTAQIVSYAGAAGGPDMSATAAPGTLSATTGVRTSEIQVSAIPGQRVTPLAAGRTATFDVTVTVPEGTTRDLRIDEILPQTGTAWLHLVSAEIVRVGANLTASNPAPVQPDGSVTFGTVVDTPDNLVTAADQIVVRLTVERGGSTAGIGTLTTTVSAADPNNAAQRWSQTVTNTVAVDKPNVAPTITGLSANQNATTTMQVRPFAGLTLTDPDPGQTETLTVHLSDPALGTLSGALGLTVNSSGDYVLQGTVAGVQAAARSLVFVPASGNTGTESFWLTLDDGTGGVARDSSTSVTVGYAADSSDCQRYPVSPAGSILTSTATGSSTVSLLESYSGPADNLQGQFIYDGRAPLAMVAQSPGLMLVSKADAAAVQLSSGNNILNMQRGSNFLVSGTGTDTFLLDARQPEETWNTIVNFHPGDNVTVWGFRAGVSRLWWDVDAGAPSYTGATLRMDLDNDGRLDSSVTFAGKSMAESGHYLVTLGNAAGSDYLTIRA